MDMNSETWQFDQTPNTACITCPSVMNGGPVLVVTHYADDHSWAFLDGEVADPSQALVVAMSEVLRLHPELRAIANLQPGHTLTRESPSTQWIGSPSR